jgi:hypothetical protein
MSQKAAGGNPGAAKSNSTGGSRKSGKGGGGKGGGGRGGSGT